MTMMLTATITCLLFALVTLTTEARNVPPIIKDIEGSLPVSSAQDVDLEPATKLLRPMTKKNAGIPQVQVDLPMLEKWEDLNVLNDNAQEFGKYDEKHDEDDSSDEDGAEGGISVDGDVIDEMTEATAARKRNGQALLRKPRDAVQDGSWPRLGRRRHHRRRHHHHRDGSRLFSSDQFDVSRDLDGPYAGVISVRYNGRRRHGYGSSREGDDHPRDDTDRSRDRSGGDTHSQDPDNDDSHGMSSQDRDEWWLGSYDFNGPDRDDRHEGYGMFGNRPGWPGGYGMDIQDRDDLHEGFGVIRDRSGWLAGYGFDRHDGDHWPGSLSMDRRDMDHGWPDDYGMDRPDRERGLPGGYGINWPESWPTDYGMGRPDRDHGWPGGYGMDRNNGGHWPGGRDRDHALYRQIVRHLQRRRRLTGQPQH